MKFQRSKSNICSPRNSDQATRLPPVDLELMTQSHHWIMMISPGITVHQLSLSA